MAQLDVDLMEEEHLVARSFTRDISFGGAFVAMKGIPRPALDSKLDLVFKLGDDAHTTKYRVHARVVRETDDGIGLMFKDFDASAFRSLRELLRHKDEFVSTSGVHA